MASKTFKIGEYSKGGVIVAETGKNKATIILKNWDMSAGTKRGSNQSNAKEYDRLEVSLNESDAERKLMNFLEDDTTHYYASTIMEWVKSKVQFTSSSWW